VHITIVIDDQNGTGNPNPNTWASWHGLTHPVLGDGPFTLAANYVPGESFGIPCYTILDRELRVVSRGESGWLDTNLISQLLAEPAPPVSWPMP
jgi:hypothetical protein